MKSLRVTVLLLAGLATTQVQAWGNHSLATYRAFEKMPEVANAAPVVAEPLDAFLRAEENTLEALLASQEAWAISNLEKYPARPAELAFKADPARSDPSRLLAFLMALRVATNSKLALYYQADLWNPVSGTPLPYSAVSPLPETPGANARYLAVTAGDMLPPLAVLASAADEPDYGLDVNLWADSPSDWGSVYGFGPQPFGNPSLPHASEAPFQMAFLHESRLLKLAAPFTKRTFPLLRSHQFASLASLAFRTGHAYWGWRFAGMSLHYVQDLTQPYHATLAPAESSAKLLAAHTLAMAGLSGMKHDLLTQQSNRHLVLEKYQSELLQRSAARQQESALERALHNMDKDRSYPDWSDRYVRETVSLQANRAAAALAQNLIATMPANYVSDPGFDFRSQEGSINLLAELAGRDSPERARLDATLAELTGNFGAHSRNALRGILRESTPH